MRTLLWHNKYHLGDCVWHLDYMHRLQDANRQEQFSQVFFCHEVYHAELLKLNTGYKNIEFKPYSPVGIDCWIGNEYFSNSDRLTTPYNEHQYQMYQKLSNATCLTNPYANRYDIANSTRFSNDWYVGFDVLLINSKPKSSQWTYDESAFRFFLDKCKYKIITTEHVHGFTCTKTCEMSLFDIGSLSCGVKYIVGICTGPLTAAMNRWSISNCDKMYICHEFDTFDYGPKVRMIRTNEELANLRLE